MQSKYGLFVFENSSEIYAKTSLDDDDDNHYVLQLFHVDSIVQ